VYEKVYVVVVRNASEGLPFNWADSYDDNQLVELAELWCEAWATGMSFDVLAVSSIDVFAEIGYDTDTDIEMLGFAIGAGTDALCPEYNDRIS